MAASTTKRLFPKPVRIPPQIRSSAQLWTDVYVEALSILLANHEKYSLDNVESLVIVQSAHCLADNALSAFENRWPGVKL